MKKDSSKYSSKASEFIKDIDSDKREVAVYLSVFDEIDSDNDIIKRGAFKKSLKERGVNSKSNRKIAFLRYHDWEMPIGKFITLEEDDKGLFAVGQLGTSSLGEDAWRDYDEGIIREHSIGFQYIEDKTKFREDKTLESGGYYEIKELKLWEGSAVTFGANEHTNVVDVMKAADKPDYALKIFKEIEVLQKSLINGQGTDERLYNIEMKLKYLQSQLLLLAEADPSPRQSVESQANETPSKQKDFAWSKVFNDLEHKETYGDYPQAAKNNAARGIRLNEAVGNKCATAVGKNRARQLVAGESLSLSTLRRTFSYLSRAEEYYNPSDTKACGTISYLLWGGLSMKSYCERKLRQIDN